MSSQIAWLDASTEDQQRMREIIRLFADRDSRDELGLGQIRDVLSDALFPGTSVLLTRARYLLFVPWCFQLAEGKDDAAKFAEKYERILIGTLKNSGLEDLAGLLGSRAGAQLKILPSTIYWTPIRHYEIVKSGYSWASDVFGDVHRDIRGDDDDGQRTASAWHGDIPPVPAGFPHSVDSGFALTRQEAEWLQERILATAEESLLSHLAIHRPDDDSESPWADSSALSVTGPTAELLQHAKAISTLMHGAALLYNLLVAEDYERLVPEKQRSLTAPSADYQERLDTWFSAAHETLQTGWTEDAAWRWLAAHRPGSPVSPSTRSFIESWVSIVRRLPKGEIDRDERARRLIRAREKSQKGTLARLGNPKRLTSWAGASGAGQLMFRWGTVRRILLDIHQGLDSHA